MPAHRYSRLIFGLIIMIVLVATTRNLYRRHLNGLLQVAIRKADVVSARSLLDQGADPNDRVVTQPERLFPSNADVRPKQSLLDMALDTMYARNFSPGSAASIRANAETIACLMMQKALDHRAVAPLNRALVTACSSGCLELTHYLLDHGANPNARDAQPAVGRAIDYGLSNAGNGERREISKKMVRMLRDHGAHVTVFDAARSGDTFMLKSLLDAGAAVDERGAVFDFSGLFMAAQSGNLDVVKLLLAHGADPNSRAGDGATPLMAALRGSPVAVVPSAQRISVARALLAHGADPNAQRPRVMNRPAESPLIAAIYTQPEFVSELLAHGANANPPDDGPLKAAIMVHRIDIVRLLLRRGASANPTMSTNSAIVSNGPSALTTAVDNYDSSLSPLMLAVIMGRSDCFAILIQADAHISRDRSQILLAAAISGCAVLMPVLVAAGADVNAADSLGETVLTQTMLHAPVMVPLLLKHGANPNIVTHAARTPLNLAAETGNTALVKLLLQYHADPNVAPPRGHTALHFARKRNHLDIMGILQKAGATLDR